MLANKSGDLRLSYVNNSTKRFTSVVEVVLVIRELYSVSLRCSFPRQNRTMMDAPPPLQGLGNKPRAEMMKLPVCKANPNAFGNVHGGHSCVELACCDSTPISM